MIPEFRTEIRNALGKESARSLSEPDWDYETIEQIWDSFQDEASKKQYKNEFIYLALRESGIDKAEKYSPCSSKQWQSASLLAKILQNGFQFQRLNGWQMPKLDSSTCSQEAEFYLNLTCISTFIFEQYRYGNHVCIRDKDVVLDCGACVGDSAIWALGYGASSIHCFEPDMSNLVALKNNSARYGEGKIEIVPYAVGNEVGAVHFAHNHTKCTASKITDDTASWDQTVQMIRIDDYVKEHGIEPSFIKMDVEGGEMDALAGAKETLVRYKPQLAICLYHKPSDMWTIPEFIREILPEYRYWCRKNNPVCEFILYASAES